MDHNQRLDYNGRLIDMVNKLKQELAVNGVTPEQLQLIAEAEELLNQKTEAPAIFYESLGWMHAVCCGLINLGRDPRTVSVTELIQSAEADFHVKRKLH